MQLLIDSVGEAKEEMVLLMAQEKPLGCQDAYQI